MIRLNVFSRYKWDGTQCASISLSLVQHQPLFHRGFPSHLFFLALLPIRPQGRVIGRMSSYNLLEPGDRGLIGFDQCGLSIPKCPVAILLEVASFHPWLMLDSRVLCDQQLNERMKQRFASLSGVVHKLEKTEVKGDCSKDTGFIQPVHDGVRRGFVDGLRLGLLATCPAPSVH